MPFASNIARLVQFQLGYANPGIASTGKINPSFPAKKTSKNRGKIGKSDVLNDR
jgi:hypothetical protein